MDSPSTRVLAARLLGASADAAAASTGPSLRIVSGPGSGRSIRVCHGDVVGRGRSAAIVLRDPAASREHVRIERSGDALTAVDLSSKNGFAVNDTRVGSRATLRDGDRLSIGATVLEVVSPSRDPVPAHPAPAAPPETRAGRGGARPAHGTRHRARTPHLGRGVLLAVCAALFVLAAL